MQTKKVSIGTPEMFFDNLKHKISKNDKISFLSGFILNILIHFFVYSNLLIVHDSAQLFNNSNGIANGRFLINLLMPIFSRITIPWFIGLLTSLLVGLVTMFLVRILEFKKVISIIMVSAIITTYPTMLANHLYFSSAYIYVFAMLMSILTVYFADKKIILSVFTMILSLSCYQAYICFTLTLMIVKIINDMLCGKINGKKVFRKGLKYVLIVAVSVILYFALWKLIMAICSIEAISYRGYDNISNQTAGGILANIITTYAYSFFICFKNYFRLHSIAYICSLIINILALVLTFINMRKQKKCILWTIVLFLLIPITMPIILIINPADLHLLMISAMSLLPILFIKNIEILNLKIINIQNSLKWLSFICVFALTFSFAVKTNVNYVKLNTQYNNSISYCTRIVDRLENTDNFTEETKVILVCDELKYGLYSLEDWSRNAKFQNPTNANGAITYPQTLVWFLTENLNINMNIMVDQNNEYKNIDAVKQLEAFPSKNCTTWIEDVLVLKIK